MQSLIKKYFATATIVTVYFLPHLAHAGIIDTFVNKLLTEIINPFIVLLFAVATVIFLWGIVQYVIGSQGNDTKLSQGKLIMFWGIIGMFIMASAWGIVRLLCDIFENSTCI